MERFYNEEEDDDEKNSFFNPNSDGYEDDSEDEEVVGYIDKQGIIDVMNMDLVQTKLNQHLLSKAVEIAQNSWFWCFKNNDKKIEEINNIFQKLANIITDYEKGIEETEE